MLTSLSLHSERELRTRRVVASSVASLRYYLLQPSAQERALLGEELLKRRLAAVRKARMADGSEWSGGILGGGLGGWGGVGWGRVGWGGVGASLQQMESML